VNCGSLIEVSLPIAVLASSMACHWRLKFFALTVLCTSSGISTLDDVMGNVRVTSLD
jgi:hypothetical protein